MTKILDGLKGAKTYIVAIITGGLGIYIYMTPEFVMPEYIWAILAALGLGAVRDGMPDKK